MNIIALLEYELLQQIWEHILEHNGMISGTPDSDKPNTAAASDDPLQTIKEVCMDDLNVQVVPEENNETVTAEEVVDAAQPAPAQTAPTGYYDKFSRKYVQVTEKMNSKQKTKAVIKAVLWLLVGFGGLCWMIYSIFNLVF